MDQMCFSGLNVLWRNVGLHQESLREEEVRGQVTRLIDRGDDAEKFRSFTISTQPGLREGEVEQPFHSWFRAQTQQTLGCYTRGLEIFSVESPLRQVRVSCADFGRPPVRDTKSKSNPCYTSQQRRKAPPQEPGVAAP